MSRGEDSFVEHNALVVGELITKDYELIIMLIIIMTIGTFVRQIAAANAAMFIAR